MLPVNLREFEPLARARLSPMVYDYIAGGAEDEYTVADNEAAFRRLKLRTRILTDVRVRDLSTEVFGQRIAFPVMIGPTSHQRLAHPDGELAVARAAAAAGTIAIFGTGTHYSIEEIAAATSGPLWFQLYSYQNRSVTERIIRRAENAGCRALVVTVDGSYPARRERHLREAFVLPPDIEMRNLVGVGMEDESLSDTPRTAWGPNAVRFLAGVDKFALTWDDITWLRQLTPLPIVIKGVLSAEDAVMALDHGVDGLVVSNHGGRQQDSFIASIAALPDIVAAVGGKLEILLDSGVRRGTDVLKALALGAKAVLIARPYLWGLAVDGEAGVCRVLELLHDEIETAMVQLGRPTIADIDRSLIS